MSISKKASLQRTWPEREAASKQVPVSRAERQKVGDGEEDAERKAIRQIGHHGDVGSHSGAGAAESSPNAIPGEAVNSGR